jgi:hypothetical protein
MFKKHNSALRKPQKFPQPFSRTVFNSKAERRERKRARNFSKTI